MSKLEEALAKANKIRESGVTGKSGRFDALKKDTLVKLSNPYVVTANQPDSHIAEEYRRLKSMLIRDTKTDFLNTIMITSATNAEGKSLTAVNLAVTLAQEIDHSILLIDADIRRPMIHKYLGIEYKYGLSDYLSGDIDISEILLKTGIGNMVCIPAGRMVNNPVELLSSEKMKTFLNEIKHRYMDRYVIIDTPPVLSCAETISIGSLVDGILFVVREGHAQGKAIEEALSMLRGVNILGAVFNKASRVNIDGYYHRYSYKYHKRDRS